MKLYRPIGLKELQLIKDLDYKEFPPRLHWQPIFYPVLNEKYAQRIAEKWNTKDENSDYCGFITMFDIDDDYISQFEVQVVGDSFCQELWIPAEDLEMFNSKIIGKISIIKAFYGDKYSGEQLELTT